MVQLLFSAMGPITAHNADSTSQSFSLRRPTHVHGKQARGPFISANQL
jgi:hypothetical protein